MVLLEVIVKELKRDIKEKLYLKTKNNFKVLTTFQNVYF